MNSADVKPADEQAYRRKLRAFVEALDGLLSLTGPNNEPPNFAADIAAGEIGIGDEAYAIWLELELTLAALPLDMPPDDVEGVDSWLGPAGLWLKALPRIARCSKLLLDLHKRWQVPFVPDWSKGILCAGGRYYLDGEADWHPIIPPLMEKGEHATLVWARNVLKMLARDPGPSEHEPLAAAEPAGVMPRPIVVIGRPGEPTTIDGEQVPPLTEQQYATLRALAEAHPRRLSLVELVHRSSDHFPGNDYPYNILTYLAVNVDSRWKEVISRGGAHRGYGLNGTVSLP